jgi:hypothetical protein
VQCLPAVLQAGEQGALIIHKLFIIMSVAVNFNTTQKKSIAVPGLNCVFEISPMWLIHLLRYLQQTATAKYTLRDWNKICSSNVTAYWPVCYDALWVLYFQYYADGYLNQALTVHCDVLLQNLTVVQLLNKFPAFYVTEIIIIVFTRAHHWSLSWTCWIQSTPQFVHLSAPFQYCIPIYV